MREREREREREGERERKGGDEMKGKRSGEVRQRENEKIVCRV